MMNLELAGIKHGCHLVGNGGDQKRHFICQESCMYQGGSKQDQQSPSKQEYRRETLHFDCMNSCGSTGKQGYAMEDENRFGIESQRENILVFYNTMLRAYFLDHYSRE